MPRSYYNEYDPFAAEWLRVLITMGHIPEGDVDTRSIEDVLPNDLIGYTQCHFFAGIGGWPLALRLAGWSESRPVWSGSCPCQPFSAAGKGNGFNDERHLWPAYHYLIATRRPVELFGEQVASKPGLAWLDTVQSDLEATGYSFGAIDLCAAGVGAPHIRQRLYFGAYDSIGKRDDRGRTSKASFANSSSFGSSAVKQSERYGNAGECSKPDSTRRNEGRETCAPLGYRNSSEPTSCSQHRCDSIATGLQRYGGNERNWNKPGWLSEEQTRSIAATGATRGFWSDAEWWHGRDEKYRPIEPGVFPLAHGVSGRVGKLRGFGNAIVPELAAEFIKAWEEITK